MFAAPQILRRQRRPFSRTLRLESLEQRLPLVFDDSLAEAIPLGNLSSPQTVNGSISPDVDVDVYRFNVAADQTIDFDIDTPLNGPGGLGSFLRIFDGQGRELAFNNDAAAPGENVVGFDSYVRFTFTAAGTFFVGVSNANNTLYNVITGGGDVAGGPHSVGNYQLIVQALPVDTDDTLAEATSLGAIGTSPDIVNASISPDIDVDIYRFTVVAGQTVDFDIDTPFNGPGGLGSFLRLFNAQGAEIDFNDDAAAPGEGLIGFDSYLRLTFATAGTFFIGVSNNTNTLYDPITGGNDRAGGLHSIGNYQLSVQTAPVVSADADDSLTEATPLGTISTTPEVIDALISPDVDVDIYSFTVTAGQTIDFDIDTPFNGPGGLGSFLRLFNSLGTELAFNDDARAPGELVLGFDAYRRFTFAVAGTYFVGISNLNNTLYNPLTGEGDVAGGLHATGSYQLIVQALPVDPDDALVEATVLGPISATPAVVNASISPDVDVDMYAFTVTAGQVVDFDIDTPFNGPGGLGSFLRLFSSQGVELAFNNDGTAPGENVLGFDAYLRFAFATAGTYFIGVSNSNNTLYNPVTGDGDAAAGLHSIGNYQVSVQTAPVTVADPDDSIAEATLLRAISTTPAVINDSISIDVDVDVFAFTVAAGQVVDFDIDTPLNGPGGLGSFLRVFNAQGQELAFNNDGIAPGETQLGFDAYLRFTFVAGGTYYVGVSNSTNTLYNPITGGGDTAGGQNTVGSYQLSVQTPVATPVDPDDSISEAIPLGAISTTAVVANGSISPDVDVDLYSFTVDAGQAVDFDIDTPLNGPGGLGSYLRVFNGLGQELTFNDNAASPGESVIGFDAYVRFTFIAAGTYYVGVSNSNNTFYNAITGAGDSAGGLNTTGNYQLIVQTPTVAPVDLDDSISEAIPLGVISTTPAVTNGSISPDVDVDLYAFTAAAGQVVDFDIDTPFNGPGGLGSFLRLFNEQGQQLAFNDNGAAPGESLIGFDAYLRFTFAANGTYYVGVSNANNTSYSPVTGGGDIAGGANATGSYQLIVNSVPVGVPTLTLTTNASSIPESNGTATGTVIRSNSTLGQALIVTLASSDNFSATTPASVIIPANQSSATFTISAIHDTTRGTRQVTITATATGHVAGTTSLLVTDSDRIWHNAANPPDVNNNGIVAPVDAILVINFLNAHGGGPVPIGNPPPFLDVDGNNVIAPVDAIIVINVLNSRASALAEGESSVFQADAIEDDRRTVSSSEISAVEVFVNEALVDERATITVNRAPAASRIDDDFSSRVAPGPTPGTLDVRKQSSPLFAPLVSTDAQDSKDALDGFFTELGSALLDDGDLIS